LRVRLTERAFSLKERASVAPYSLSYRASEMADDCASGRASVRVAIDKDVLSQADILIAMKLTASQDRDAIGAWIEGQADRQEGKRILGDLPRLQRGEGYLWAPGHSILDRVGFPAIRTFDSSRTPKRGERLATPRTLAEVDLTAIMASLAAVEIEDPGKAKTDRRREAQLERELAAARARIELFERENRELNSQLAEIAALAAGTAPAIVTDYPVKSRAPKSRGSRRRPCPPRDVQCGRGIRREPASRHPQAAACAHPACAGAIHLGSGRDACQSQTKRRPFQCRPQGSAHPQLCCETSGLVTPTPDGLKAAGEVPSTPAERLVLWCDRLP
jgi:hypothetical protein